MSKLEELIAELCPDGVEYKKLGDVATITRGGNFQKKDYVENGIPCIHYGQIYTQYGLFVNETISFISEEIAKKQKMANTDDIIMAVTSENIDDVCKCVAWLGKGEIAVSGHTAIIQHSLNPKYLVYYFHSMMFYKQKTKLANGTKVIEVTPSKLVNIIIPVPPLPVQREIVRILDNFTELTTELTMVLATELTARKKQYEYYVEHLLNSKDDVPMEALGEIFSTVTDYVAAGSFASIAENVSYKSEPDYAQLVRTMDIKSSFTKGSNVYVDENAFKFLCRVNLNEESIIMPNIGVNCGEVYFVTPEDLPYDNNVLGPNAILLRSEKYNNKYLFYLLKTNTFQKALKIIISPGGQTKFNKTELKKLKLPIPSLEEQNRIVVLLDRFNTLCNDISTGLPTEIEARQKQYEYYRDKLLTFKELS
jgi:type I restriction enzyme, S subunit